MRLLAILLVLLGLSISAHAEGRSACMGPHLLALAELEEALLQVQDDPQVHKENTRLVAALLAVTLGPFGAHRLYLGTVPKVAIIYGVTFGGFGVLAVIDLVHILCTKDLTPYRNNDKVFMWASERRRITPP